MGILLLIIGLVLFIGLIITHELGHYFAAKRAGVVAEEFGIFFPPRLYKKKLKSGLLFTINLLPLGGFVKLKGEHDSDKGPGAYGAASTTHKIQIMLAGVAVNLVTALILLMVLAWVGMPKLIDNQFTVKSDTKISQSDVLIGYIEPGSPAAKAGLVERDTLKSISDQDRVVRISSSEQLPQATRQFAGQAVTVTYERGGQEGTTRTTLLSKAAVDASLKTDDPKGYLGIQPISYSLQRSTWSAPIVAVGLAGQFTSLTFQGLGHALAGLGGIFAGAVTGNSDARQNAQAVASSQVSGPVGIFVVLKDGSLLGYQFMLLIIAIISLTLAIMNVLPIPALDGGRVFVTLLSRIIKKPISAKAEEAIYGSGFVILMLLIVVISVVDVKRFF